MRLTDYVSDKPAQQGSSIRSAVHDSSLCSLLAFYTKLEGSSQVFHPRPDLLVFCNDIITVRVLPRVYYRPLDLD